MTWTLVAHRSELAKPGDFVLLSGGAQQQVAYNKEGTIIVADNICRHRGARIFSEPHGNRPLVCPYHGFSGDAAMKAKDLTAWIGDWLFAGDGTTRLEDDLAGLADVLASISERIAKRHSFDSLPMPCAWDVAIENTLEDLHVASVHRDTFGKLDLRLSECVQNGKNSVGYYTLGDEHMVKRLGVLARSFEAVQPESYFHIFLYPFTCLSSVGGFSYSLQHYLPAAASFTQLHTRLYQGKLKPDAPNLDYFFDEAANFNRMVFAQDSAICARVVTEGTYLTQAEQRVKWFREQ